MATENTSATVETDGMDNAIQPLRPSPTVNSMRPSPTANSTAELEKAGPIATADSEVAYTVFSPAQRRAICAAAIFSALFSPLATNIYFPAITIIADDLRVNVEKVNITVMTYMICQGLAPMFWATFADARGRRPVYISTLSVFVLANLILALQHSYVGLLVVRMLQSAGSSATVAIGAGTIADITVQAERGTYMGAFSGGVMIAPALAPVFGGALAQAPYGWRSLFWFLFGASAAVLTVLFVWMPETGRKIVGNGSIPARGWNRSLLQILAQKRDKAQPAAPPPKRPFGNPLRCLKIIGQKDVGMILLANGFIYTSFYCVTVGFSSQVKAVYKLTTLQIGLCFLPYGFGCMIGSMVGGRLLDYEFRNYARRAGYSDPRVVRHDPNFPVEKARMQVVWFNVGLVAADCAAFGWTFRERISLAVPLVLLFMNGMAVTGFFNFVSVILMDLYPHESASVTASNNLVRCLLGAVGSAVVEKIINAIGMGWTFTAVACMVLFSIPCLLAEYCYGHGWRLERVERDKLAKKRLEQQALEESREDQESEPAARDASGDVVDIASAEARKQ